MNKPCFVIRLITIIISYISTLVILSIIIGNRKRQKEMVYYLSKIATVKNIVKMNHQSQIFNDFNENGELMGININYQKLLQLITEKGCKKAIKNVVN